MPLVGDHHRFPGQIEIDLTQLLARLSGIRRENGTPVKAEVTE